MAEKKVNLHSSLGLSICLFWEFEYISKAEVFNGLTSSGTWLECRVAELMSFIDCRGTIITHIHCVYDSENIHNYLIAATLPDFFLPQACWTAKFPELWSTSSLAYQVHDKDALSVFVTLRKCKTAMNLRLESNPLVRVESTCWPDRPQIWRLSCSKAKFSIFH